MRWLRRIGDSNRENESGARPRGDGHGNLLDAIRRLKQEPQHNAALGSFIERSRQDGEGMLSDMSSLQARLEDLLLAFGEAMEEVASLRSERVRLTARVEDLSLKNDEFGAANTTLGKENKALKSLRADQELALDTLRVEHAALQLSNAGLSEEFGEARQRADTFERELGISAEALEKAERQGKAARDDHDQTREKLRAVQAVLDAERTNAQLLAERTSREVGHLEKEVAELRSLSGKLQDEKTHHEQRIGTLERDLERARNDFHEADLQLRQKTEELDGLRSDLHAQLASLSAKNEAVIARAALSERLLETARERNNSHSGIEQQLRREIQAARREIAEKASRASSLAGALERVQGENAEMYRSLKELERVLAGTNGKLDEALAGRDKANQELEQIRSDTAEVTESQEAARERLTARLSIAEAQIRELTAQRDTLSGQIEQMRSRTRRGDAKGSGQALPVPELEKDQMPSAFRGAGLNVVSMAELSAKGE